MKVENGKLKNPICYIAFFLVLTSCVRSVDERLMRVDELAERNETDSATLLLQRIDVDSLNEHNRHFYDLMTIKTRDKSYKNIANDTAIVEIIEYFEKKGTRDEQSEAYYYGGRVYREMGDLPQSLDYFQKALDVLGDAPSRLKGKISSQMGQMFLNLQMFDLAIPQFHNAVQYNKMYADSVNLIYNYRAISDCYYKLNNSDSTIFYLKAVLNVAESIENERKSEIKIRNSIVDYYIKQRDYETARKEYAVVDSLRKKYDFNKDYLVYTEINMSIINGDYAKTEQLSKQLTESSSVDSRWFAYGILKDIAKQRGNNTDSYNYLCRYEACIDSINADASRDAVVHQNSFYNYSLREKENVFLKAKQQRLLNSIFIIVVVLLILATCVWVYVYKNRNLKLQLTLLLSKIEKLQLQSSPKREINVEDMTIEQLQNEYHIAFKQLTKNINLETYCIPNEILESKIYHKFKDSISNESVKIDKEDWSLLNEIVNSVHKDFKLKLYRFSNKISEHEYQMCLLVKCRFSNVEISKLTNRERSSISHAKKRLYKKLLNVGGVSEDLERLILSL